MSMPLFSIITVTKNNLAGLKKTQASLGVQTFDAFEWIIIDGASTDGTVDYLAAGNADWTSEPDSGLYDAMNKGLERATGMFVLFLNAGDMLAAPDTLETLAAYITERELIPDFIYGDALEDWPGMEPRHKPARPYTKIAQGMFTHHQAMLYRREALDGLRYNTAYTIAADYDFTCRFLRTAQNVTYIPAPLCLFESGGVSQRNAELGRREQVGIRRKLQLCSPLKAALIYTGQAIASTLKSLAPQLYWRLKHRAK